MMMKIGGGEKNDVDEEGSKEPGKKEDEDKKTDEKGDEIRKGVNALEYITQKMDAKGEIRKGRCLETMGRGIRYYCKVEEGARVWHTRFAPGWT